MTRNRMFRVNAHWWGANFDDNARRAADGVATAWIRSSSVLGAAQRFVLRLNEGDRASLRTVHVVEMNPTPYSTVYPNAADMTLRHNDGRALRHPVTQDVYTVLDGDSFHWIATQTDGQRGGLAHCAPPANAERHEPLAWALLEAARLYNASYVPPVPESGVTFGHHAVSLDAAAERVTDDALEATLVSTMLFAAWNDTLDWATCILERHTPHPGDARDREAEDTVAA